MLLGQESVVLASGAEGAEGLHHGVGIQPQMGAESAHHRLDEDGFRQFVLITSLQCGELLHAHVHLAGELLLTLACCRPRFGQLTPCLNQARGCALVVCKPPFVH